MFFIFIRNIIICTILCYVEISHCFVSDNNKTPITITSSNLNIDHDKNTLEYFDDVIVKQGNLKITCNKMVVYYVKVSQEKGSDISIEKINFFDKVTINKDKKIAIGDSGEFNSKTKLVTITNNVSLKDNNNYIEGDRVIYNTKTNIFKIFSDKKPDNRVRILVED